MTDVLTENCIRCECMDCVEAFPGDCFYAGENMLVIHLDECIDCDVCEPECPAESILPGSDKGATPEWLALNSTSRGFGRTCRLKRQRLQMPPTGSTAGMSC